MIKQCTLSFEYIANQMYIEKPEKRLSQFWGKVNEKHILSFVPFIKGPNILDVGCGLGATTGYITNKFPGFNCIGIDSDSEEIEKAGILFPRSQFMNVQAENLPFGNDFFDTIIIRDTLHHLYEDPCFTKALQEIMRVSNKDSRLILFDPNVNFILRMFRKFSNHKDAECRYETAREILINSGFREIYSAFNTVFSLPLSGGYVGYNFIPGIDVLQKSILFSEKGCEKIINFLGAGRYLCWRYLLVGQKG